MQDLILSLYVTAKSALSRNDGQSMTEYAMAVGLIALGCVAGEAAIATSVNHVFVAMGTTIVNGVMR
jgi:Flp pilus assembly pilin Flp